MRMILSTIVCWLVVSVVCIDAYSEDSGTASQGSPREKTVPTIQMSDITKPLEDAAKETKILSIFLKDSNTKYNEATRTIEQEERDYKSAVAKAEEDEQKRQLTLEYLARRSTFIDLMMEDLNFVNEKLQEKAGTINSLIGAFGQKSDLITKAERAAQDTTETVRKIEALKRDARILKAESPEAGSEEYMEWFNKQVQLRVDFRKQVGELRRSLKKALLYNKLGNCVKLTKADAQQWQAFILSQTVAFSEAKQDLITEKEMAKDYIEFLKATRAFGEIKQFSEFAKSFTGMVSKLTESELPDPVAVGSIADTTPPEVKLDSLDDILSFDPARYIESVRKIESAPTKNTQGTEDKAETPTEKTEK